MKSIEIVARGLLLKPLGCEYLQTVNDYAIEIHMIDYRRASIWFC